MSKSMYLLKYDWTFEKDVVYLEELFHIHQASVRYTSRQLVFQSVSYLHHNGNTKHSSLDARHHKPNNPYKNRAKGKDVLCHRKIIGWLYNQVYFDYSVHL